MERKGGRHRAVYDAVGRLWEIAFAFDGALAPSILYAEDAFSWTGTAGAVTPLAAGETAVVGGSQVRREGRPQPRDRRQGRGRERLAATGDEVEAIIVAALLSMGPHG